MHAKSLASEEGKQNELLEAWARSLAGMTDMKGDSHNRWTSASLGQAWEVTLYLNHSDFVVWGSGLRGHTQVKSCPALWAQMISVSTVRCGCC